MKAGRRPVFLSQPLYELPFEKSTENLVQNTAQGSNENITSLFAVFFRLISAVLGILTFVALIIYYVLIDSTSWTTLRIDRSMKSMIIGAAYTTRVPETRQSSWQKAAGMFQACVALVKSGRGQRDDLLNWLASVHLDLRDWTALNTVDPKDMIVRCSLDFGVHVIIAIKLYDEVFARKKRQIYMAYSESDEQWWITTRSLPQNELFELYIHFLNLYGFHDEIAVNLAEYISLIERTIDSIALSNSATYSPVVVGSIQDMGQLTAPYITGVEWASAFAKHTNNSYLGGDSIMYTAHPLYTVAGLFATVDAGGIRFLIAWSLFRQLVPFANPTFFLNDDALTDTCYTDVQKVMKLAFAAPYLHHVTNIDTVKMATSMVRRIREAFRTALNTSSWVTGVAREVAIEKISNMQSHLGSPGQRLDPAKIDDYYDNCPRNDARLRHGWNQLWCGWHAARMGNTRVSRKVHGKDALLERVAQSCIDDESPSGCAQRHHRLGELGRFCWHCSFLRGLHFLTAC
nr:uncharacterized protein LOC119171733 [Rhipicephalus microplus]